MYKIFVDSDSDFTLKEARKYDLGLISMPYEMENGENIYPYVDYEEFDPKPFYDKLRSGYVPKTAALNANEYIDMFEPFMKEGKDIIYISFSNKLSSTFNGVRMAKEVLKEKYPDRFIEVIDTKGIFMLAYLVGLEIIEYIQSGDRSIEEIRAFASDMADHTACYLYADNLKFFAKSGRVPSIAALAGGVIGIKPIICLDEEGCMRTVDKIRGRKNALERLMEIVDELQDHIADYTIGIAHTDNEELATQLMNMVKAKYGPNLKFEFHVTNPTNGAHAGPDCVGVIFHCKKRTI